LDTLSFYFSWLALKLTHLPESGRIFIIQTIGSHYETNHKS
jgi:hypothetical protein